MKGGAPPRLDFILRDREPGALHVSASVWAVDPDDPGHQGIIPAWQHWAPEQAHTVPSTLVNRPVSDLVLPPLKVSSHQGARLRRATASRTIEAT